MLVYTELVIALYLFNLFIYKITALLAVLRYTGDQHIFWSDLALVLGFSETEAEYIRSDNCRTQDQKRDFFKRWLDKGNASWAILVSALRHPQVQGGGFIARKIVEDHPKDGCMYLILILYQLSNLGYNYTFSLSVKLKMTVSL